MYGRRCRNIPDLAASKGAVATDNDSVYVSGAAPSMSVAARKIPLEGRLLPFSLPGFLSSSRTKPYAMRVPLGVAAAGLLLLLLLLLLFVWHLLNQMLWNLLLGHLLLLGWFIPYA